MAATSQTLSSVRRPRPLSLKEVAALFNVTGKTITKWVRLGRFPRPYRPGGSKMFWNSEAIEKALAGESEAAEA
jgi:predicted DNA-binding transcriptional regulator AlpA